MRLRCGILWCLVAESSLLRSSRVSPQFRAVSTVVCRYRHCDSGIDKQRTCFGGGMNLHFFSLYLRLTTTIEISGQWSTVTVPFLFVAVHLSFHWNVFLAAWLRWRSDLQNKLHSLLSLTSWAHIVANCRRSALYHERLSVVIRCP